MTWLGSWGCIRRPYCQRTEEIRTRGIAYAQTHTRMKFPLPGQTGVGRRGAQLDVEKHQGIGSERLAGAGKVKKILICASTCTISIFSHTANGLERAKQRANRNERAATDKGRFGEGDVIISRLKSTSDQTACSLINHCSVIVFCEQ